MTKDGTMATGSRPRRGAALWVVLGVGAWACVMLVGCAAPARDRGAGTDYEASYRARNYEAALRQGAAAASREGSPDRDEAALIAGLSAFALDRPQEAESWLNPLVGDSDTALSGRAGATLGLIAQSRRDHARAAGLLTDAADKLVGDEAARAAMYAGDSLAALGRRDEARAQYDRAGELARPDSPLRGALAQRASGGPPVTAGAPALSPSQGGGFTVQLGAFATRRNADLHAQKIRGRAEGAGLGTPRVVEERDRAGRMLHAVRVGRFPSERAAGEAMQRMGLGGLVTTTDGER